MSCLRTVFLLASLLLIAGLAMACGGESPKPDEGTTPDQPAGPTAATTDPEPSAFPEGYPTELALPEGFRASQLNTGSGSESGGGTGERTFRSYELWKMMPSNAPDLIAHYKKVLAEQGFEGTWKGDGVDQAARGTFTKDDMEVKVSISTEEFSFKLRVFDA